MFAMTSFGAKIDHSVNKRRGPYVFKIFGHIYHWIGSLCPEEGHHPRFLQLYLYDTRDELRNRMHHFGGLDESTLNPKIVEGLIHVLDEHNGLVRLFRTARDRYNAGDIPSFKIRLYNMGGVRGYELPTADVLGAIVFENGPRSRTDFDVIIEFRGGPPQRINKLHQSYMSLQFPLLFVFGQPGYYPELTLKPRDGRGKGKKVTMNGYYKYQLHPRKKEFGLIFKGGRLFQQYVVTIFCAIEQGRLDFIRRNQNDIRSDFLSGLYDAVSRGDREGITTGSNIMLSNTFTGGPRGLPHCHTLLWIESRNTLKDATQIDEYISAEIPDPVQDPIGYKLVTGLMMHGPCGFANLDASCDLFYFQMLMCHQKGCKSPDEVRTVNGQMLPTFRAACEALADLVKLWAKHWEAMQDDIPAKISEATGIQNYNVNNAELQGYILYELEKILNGFGKSVTDFGLQSPSRHLLKDLQNKLHMEEKNYKRDLLKQDAA
ncbi:DNA helicase [Tanacetum coccineum]